MSFVLGTTCGLRGGQPAQPWVRHLGYPLKQSCVRPRLWKTVDNVRHTTSCRDTTHKGFVHNSHPLLQALPIHLPFEDSKDPS